MLKSVHSASVAGQFDEVVKGRYLLSRGKCACKHVPVLERVPTPPLSMFSVDLFNKGRVELDLVV